MDDICPIDSLNDEENLSDQLYQLVLHGHTAELRCRLEELPNAIEHLIAVRSYGEEKLSLLMVAALHGHDGIVRLLLTFDPSNQQIKLRGQILNQDQTTMKDVNALYCACDRGHFHVAKTLIELGKADVNHSSPDEHLYARTALLIAAVKDHLELFLLLLHHGATIDKSLLKLAVRRQSHTIIRYLLDQSLISPDQLELEATSSLSWCSDREAMRNRAKPLRIALEYRQRTGLRKVCPPPSSIYDYQQECQTNDELEKTLDDRDRLLIEFLLIQERLLPLDQRPKMTRLLIGYILNLLSEKRFDVCLDVCHLHLALEGQRGDDPSLNFLIRLIGEMLASNYRLPINRCLQAAQLFKKRFNQKHTQQTLDNALFMIIFATKVTSSYSVRTLSTCASRF